MIGVLSRIANREETKLLGCAANGACNKVALQQSCSWPEEDLNTCRFVVFDTETTGLNCLKGDEIISIAAIVIEQGEITESTFSSLVDPKRDIPPIATEITGINNQMVTGSPDIMTVLDKFLEFTGYSVLVAHHAQFDLGFINRKLHKYCKYKLNLPVLDTYFLSQLLFPHALEHSLDFVAQQYEINIEQRHTALGDAKITAEIFMNMVRDFKLKGINTTTQLLSYLRFKTLI